MHRILGPIVCLLLYIPAFAQRVSPRALEAVQTIRELRAIGIPEDEQNNPPAKVPGLLRKLNSQLLAVITETITDKKRLGTIANAEEVFAHYAPQDGTNSRKVSGMPTERSNKLTLDFHGQDTTIQAY